MAKSKSISGQLVDAAKQLVSQLEQLKTHKTIHCVYNPLVYAWDAYREYLTRYALQPSDYFYLGMNPGPWGMAQTGVPFGEINAVRSWLKIEATIRKPSIEHPKRPIEGFACTRSEVSGKRLWGLFSDKFRDPDSFFKTSFVSNYCPLVFMDVEGRNVTPDKLPKSYTEQLDQACDEHLIRCIEILKPSVAIGIGGYAEQCLIRAKEQSEGLSELAITKILHPSPASPAANKNWAETARSQLEQAGIWK